MNAMWSGGMTNGAKKPKIFEPQVANVLQNTFFNMVSIKPFFYLEFYFISNITFCCYLGSPVTNPFHWHLWADGASCSVF